MKTTPTAAFATGLALIACSVTLSCTSHSAQPSARPTVPTAPAPPATRPTPAPVPALHVGRTLRVVRATDQRAVIEDVTLLDLKTDGFTNPNNGSPLPADPGMRFVCAVYRIKNVGSLNALDSYPYDSQKWIGKDGRIAQVGTGFTHMCAANDLGGQNSPGPAPGQSVEGDIASKSRPPRPAWS